MKLSTKNNKTVVVFHRCGGKSLGYPPNTILTAKWANKNGARSIEYDIVACKDDNQYKIAVIEPKLIKQANLDINNLQWSDVSRINTGNEKYGDCKAPLLEEMLSVIDNTKTSHQIHIKGNNPDIIKELLPKLKSLTDYLVTSFDILFLKELKSFNQKIPVGWIVKPKQEKGNEGLEDLTATVSADANNMDSYSDSELEEILKEAKNNLIDVIILCGPKIKNKKIVDTVKEAGFQIGAWGVGTNIGLAKTLITYNLDRFTLDNPEELELN